MRQLNNNILVISILACSLLNDFSLAKGKFKKKNLLLDRRHQAMIKRSTSKIFVILTVAAILGFGAYAFAHMNVGYGSSEWGGHMTGGHHMGYGEQSYGYMPKLSDEEINKMEKEHVAFFETTEELRDDIYVKELELRIELAKSNIDKVKATSLQKEISKLETRLDQKHLGHIINMKKINPNIARGFMGMGHMGSSYAFLDNCWK
jgi:Spy/CpxP family protein refolding chaperone